MKGDVIRVENVSGPGAGWSVAKPGIRKPGTGLGTGLRTDRAAPKAQESRRESKCKSGISDESLGVAGSAAVFAGDRRGKALPVNLERARGVEPQISRRPACMHATLPPRDMLTSS
jgi:hypothetical protein